LIAAPPSSPEKPLPDLSTFMHQVEANERTAEAVQKNYIYDQTMRFDSLDSHQGIKKTEARDMEVYWIDGVVIARTLAKNGRPLTPDELKKEDARIEDSTRKARERRDKADAEGKETDPRGHDELTFSRMLELGSFSNERRELVNGRPTIVVNYVGDPHAKTHNQVENVFHELAGTVWVDEQDQTLQHLEGHFNHDFKVAGGLVASVRQGTWFKATFRKVNGEVWLPESFEADGHARYLLFFSIDGHATGRTGNYRRFKATSTILPGVNTVADPAPPAPGPDPPVVKPPER
jgi:hypothetical protein